MFAVVISLSLMLSAVAFTSAAEGPTEEIDFFQLVFLVSALLSIVFTVATFFWRHKDNYPASKFNPKYLLRSIPALLIWYFGLYDLVLQEIVPTGIAAAAVAGWVFGAGLDLVIKQLIDIVSKAWPSE